METLIVLPNLKKKCLICDKSTSVLLFVKSKMKKRNAKIPLDTLGNPLPPPVPSYTICKIPQKKWGQWWIQHFTHTLPEENPCCVCGFSFEVWQLGVLDTDLVEINVQRQYLNGMTSSKIYICGNCKRKCDKCSKIVPEAQKKLFTGLCMACHAVTKASAVAKKIKKR